MRKINIKGEKIMAVERWTDEMLDSLASSIAESRQETRELRESMAQETRELRESMAQETRELRESMAQLGQTVDNLMINSQALLQLAAQQQQRSREIDERLVKLEEEKVENEKRFNVLIEEVRFLIHNQTNNPDNS